MDVGVVRQEVGDFSFSCTIQATSNRWQVFPPNYPPPGWYYAYSYGGGAAGIRGTNIGAGMHGNSDGDVYIALSGVAQGVVTPTVTIGPAKVGDYTGAGAATVTITAPGKKLREYVAVDASTGVRTLRRGWQTSGYTTGTIRVECGESVREGTFDATNLAVFDISISCTQVGHVGDAASVTGISFGGSAFTLTPLTYYMPGLDLAQEAGSESEIVITGSSITNTVLVEDGGFPGYITIGLPYKMTFNPASFNTDYSNPVTNIEYTVDNILKWNSSTEEYEPLTYTAATTVCIYNTSGFPDTFPGNDYKWADGVDPEPVIEIVVAGQHLIDIGEMDENWNFYNDPAVNPYEESPVAQTSAVKVNDIVSKIRVIPLGTALTSTDPWWTGGVFTIAQDATLDVWPATVAAESNVAASGTNNEIVTTTGAAASPNITYSYPTRWPLRRDYMAAYDLLIGGVLDYYWMISGPNKTDATDLQTWKDDVTTEGNGCWESRSYLQFDIVAPKNGTIKLEIDYTSPIGTFYVGSGAANVNKHFKNTILSYEVAVTTGTNTCVIDLSCPAEQIIPAGLYKMWHVNTLKFTLPDATGVEAWQFNPAAFTLIPGGGATPIEANRFICDNAYMTAQNIKFAAFSDGKDVLELGRNYGYSMIPNPVTGKEYAYYYRLPEEKMTDNWKASQVLSGESTLAVAISPFYLEAELDVQAGWGATYTAPLDSADNKDSADNYLCESFHWEDMRYKDGVIEFSPYIESAQVVSGAAFAFNHEMVIYGAIHGLLKSAEGEARIRSSATDPVYLYRQLYYPWGTYDSAEPHHDKELNTRTYTRVGSTLANGQGEFIFDSLPTGGRPIDPHYRYGISATDLGETTTEDLLDFDAVEIRHRYYTPCNGKLYVDLVSVVNRYGVMHRFYLRGSTIFMKSRVVKNAMSTDEVQVAILTGTISNLWAEYKDNYLYVGAKVNDTTERVFVSADEGETWSEVV